MSKCKIVLSCEDKSFLGKVVGMIRSSFASQGGPIGALETSCEFDGRFTMTAEPFEQDKPLSFTFTEFASLLRPAERERGSQVWSIQTMARYILTTDIKHRAGLKLKVRAAQLAEHFREMDGGDYGPHVQLASLVCVGVVTGSAVVGAARAVLATVDATCEAGERTMSTGEQWAENSATLESVLGQPGHLEPLPAQLGCIHSPEAIALAGMVMINDSIDTTAFMLAAKIIKESTGWSVGEPVAVLYADGAVLTKADCGDGFDICCKVETPLYTHADPVEVERLREENRVLQKQLGERWTDIDTLRAQLAEWNELLRELLADDVPLRLAAKIETALSASAEPATTNQEESTDNG